MVGELIETNRDLMRLQQQSIQIWKSVRVDVKAIARAVGAQVATTVRVSRPGAGPRPSSGSTRTLGGNYAGGSRSQAVVTPAGRSAAQRSNAGVRGRTSMPVAVTQQRSSNGRFVAGSGSGGGSASNSSGSSGAALGRLNDTIGRLASSLSAADNVDPTLNAAKEIKDVITPLGRGLFGMFGRNTERKKERWYQRIWKALTPGTQKARAAGGGSGGGGLGGALGGLLRGVPGMLMALFTRILGPVALLWGSWEIGKWIGGKIYEWLESSGWNTKLFDAIDSITGAFSSAWDSVTSGIDTVVKGIENTWSSITDGFKKALDSFMEFPKKIGEFFGGLDEAMRKIPVIGEAYAKAVDATKSTVADLRKGFDEGKTGNTHQTVLDASGRDINDPRRVDAPQGSLLPAATLPQAIGRDAGKVVRTVTDATSKAGGAIKGVFKGADARALETGTAYSAGNIGGLDDAQTRALVASTALTESGGGNLGVVNSAGYMGRYQAGAGWLADAGHIAGGSAAVKAAMKADGYTNEYKWGQSGGMTKFLKNDKNWSGDMTYDKYLASAATQDAAFKTNSDAAYRQMLKNGTITASTAPAEVAGLLKARHIAGMGGAMEVAKGRTGAVDANGTSARKYFDDVAGDRNGFLTAFRAGSVTPATPNLPSMPVISVPSAAPSKIPAPPELRDPPAPLNGGAGAGRGTTQINIPETTGQNVRNRALAHVVTGGLGAA